MLHPDKIKSIRDKLPAFDANVNRLGVKFNRETGIIEIPNTATEEWLASPEYAEYCWKQVAYAMMGGMTAEEIQEQYPDMWEKAFEHANRIAK